MINGTKPIFLGELGVPPYKGAYAEPWNYEWDESLYDEKIQENWLKAFYSVFGSYDWFKKDFLSIVLRMMSLSTTSLSQVKMLLGQ